MIGAMVMLNAALWQFRRLGDGSMRFLFPAGRNAMTAFNAVRFKVKPGREQEFLDAHQAVERNWPGMRHANMIKTGEGSYCIIGEWDDMDAMAAARPHMIATLDRFRDTLDGDTDPVSGPVVLALK
jgi:quinol monooxygenase YgiN